MEWRACSILAFYLAFSSARECIEITLPDRLINDSFFNATILKIAARNDSLDETARFNVLGLWERLPKVVVPRNATSEQCRKDGQVYLDSLARLELWALKSRFFLFLLVINY